MKRVTSLFNKFVFSLFIILFQSCYLLAEASSIDKNTHSFGRDIIGFTHDVLVLKSSSGNCWGIKSGTYKNIKLEFESSTNNVTNGYQDFTACLNDGGSVTESEKVRAIAAGELNAAIEKEIDSDNKFAGFNWGVGLAYTSVGDELIYDATIVDGIVQVQDSGKQRALLLVEYHYWFYRGTMWHNDIGIGPYIAVGLLGEEGVEPLSTFGFGAMLGAKDDEGGSFNVGIGFFLDTDGQVFRENIEDGSTTTATDPANLLRSVDSRGVMLMFSSTF